MLSNAVLGASTVYDATTIKAEISQNFKSIQKFTLSSFIIVTFSKTKSLFFYETNI
jgi:hypothetical protein